MDEKYSGCKVAQIQGEAVFTKDPIEKHGKKGMFTSQFLILGGKTRVRIKDGEDWIEDYVDGLGLDICNAPLVEKGEKVFVGTGTITRSEKAGKVYWTVHAWQDDSGTNILKPGEGAPKAPEPVSTKQPLEDRVTTLENTVQALIARVNKFEDDNYPSMSSVSAGKVSADQIKKIHVMANKKNLIKKDDDSSYREYLKMEFGVDSSKDLTKEQASEFIETMETWK